MIGQEKHPSGSSARPAEMRPDVVVLDLNTEGSRELGSRVQRVSPETKVILCDSDEDGMEVLDPGADSPAARRRRRRVCGWSWPTSRTPR